MEKRKGQILAEDMVRLGLTEEQLKELNWEMSVKKQGPHGVFQNVPYKANSITIQLFEKMVGELEYEGQNALTEALYLWLERQQMIISSQTTRELHFYQQSDFDSFFAYCNSASLKEGEDYNLCDSNFTGIFSKYVKFSNSHSDKFIFRVYLYCDQNFDAHVSPQFLISKLALKEKYPLTDIRRIQETTFRQQFEREKK